MLSLGEILCFFRVKQVHQYLVVDGPRVVQQAGQLQPGGQDDVQIGHQGLDDLGRGNVLVHQLNLIIKIIKVKVSWTKTTNKSAKCF